MRTHAEAFALALAATLVAAIVSTALAARAKAPEPRRRAKESNPSPKRATIGRRKTWSSSTERSQHMTTAIRQQVTVGPGGVIQIRSLELPAGARAEVIILLEGPETPAPSSLRSIIGSAKGCFATPEEADAFLRAERGR